jgi:putative ATPase
MGNLSDLRKVMDEAQECSQSIVFIDEIHRFSKAQQDALLPRVEAGHFTLIGATTENPKYVVNSALLSRCHILELQKLGREDLTLILQRALSSLNYPCPTPIQEELLNYADGDARRLLNVLEALTNSYPLPRGMIPSEDMPRIKQLIIDNCRDYDRDHNRHYDVISAFIKSMRGSDPDAALFWLAVMIDGGEDPVFIARRMIIFASEDVGNADPWALLLATSTLEAVKNIGLPEARINLGQAASYLASTVKSNAAYNGINEALEFVKNLPTPKVPDHIRTHSKSYQYPHSFPEHFVKQAYHETKLPRFYRPTEQGREKLLKERLQKLWS